jgi:predicted phosphate transport protein (TIGR00153 family)
MLDWFRRLMPREHRFFDLFNRHAALTVACAAALKGLLAGADVERSCREIVRLEHEADAITREVLLALRRTFITPFDRGDIRDLISAMDDAVDAMQKSAKTIIRFDRTSFEPAMGEIGAAIVEAADLMAEAVGLLDRIPANVDRLGSLTEQVKRVEERADAIHDDALRALYRSTAGDGAMEYVIGEEIYEHLEVVVDRLDDVANPENGIVLESV